MVIEAAVDFPIRLIPEINEKLLFLLTDKIRYKGAHGGRSAGKSVSFADAVLAKMISKKITVTAGRELDNTIRESVHKLLKERVQYHKLENFISISDRGLDCKNGSTLNYIHFHNNINGIRGLQSTDICWVFEAQTMVKDSWDELYPTIRNEGSEIWLEWNDDLEDDFVKTIFESPENANDSKLVYINYIDNPLCPQVSLNDAKKCKTQAERTGDWEDYNHIWLGYPSKVGSKIYPMFTRERHIAYGIDLDESRVMQSAMFFMGQDPATVYYPFCVWIMRRMKGSELQYIVYNEFPTLSMMNGKYFYEVRTEKQCQVTLRQRAAIFKVMDNTINMTYNNVKVNYRAIDTRFAKASGAASTTLKTEGLVHTMAMPENGGLIYQTPQEKYIDVQREEIQRLMTYDVDLGYIPGINEPNFYVMPHCHNVIHSFLHHRIDLKTKSEDPKYKDPIDAIRITMAMMRGIKHVEYKIPIEQSALNYQEPKGEIDQLVEQWSQRRIY